MLYDMVKQHIYNVPNTTNQMMPATEIHDRIHIIFLHDLKARLRMPLWYLGESGCA